MVRSCKWVDEVVTDVPYVMNDEYLRDIIEKYRIDYVVHGDDPCIVDGKDVYMSQHKNLVSNVIRRLFILIIFFVVILS